jgi:hypothetical protein
MAKNKKEKSTLIKLFITMLVIIGVVITGDLKYNSNQQLVNNNNVNPQFKLITV